MRNAYVMEKLQDSNGVDVATRRRRTKQLVPPMQDGSRDQSLY